MPSEDNAAVRVAAAVERLATNPMPARIAGPTAGMLDGIAPYSDVATRVALSNRWLTGRLVRRQLLASPDTAAALRTTTAPTIISAGTKDNVLPQAARAVVNHRILPGDTIESVITHDRKVIDDARVEIRVLPTRHNPSRPVATRSPEYQRVAGAIRATFPEAAIAPGLVLGATDGRHYEGVAKGVLRFAPFRMRKADLARFHGNDERVAIADYMRAIAFYERLMRGADRQGIRQ
jgi:carboxypeptidase PM20D1